MKYALVLASSIGCTGAQPAAPAADHPGITLLDQAPPDALALDVRVIRWSCVVTDPDGTQDSDLHVPTGRAIRLTLHNDDSFADLDVELGARAHVTHGVPVTLAFRVDRPDTYGWKCPVQQAPSKFINPPTHVIATTEQQYAANQALRREATNPRTLEGKIALGKKVYENKGCVACHTVDGTPRVGVSLAKLWGTKVTLVDGTVRTVDAAFLADSLNEPTRILRDGFPPSMPSYEGQIKPTEVDALAAYMESLR